MADETLEKHIHHMLAEVIKHAAQNPTPENITLATNLYKYAYKEFADLYVDSLECNTHMERIGLARREINDDDTTYQEYWLVDFIYRDEVGQFMEEHIQNYETSEVTKTNSSIDIKRWNSSGGYYVPLISTRVRDR